MVQDDKALDDSWVFVIDDRASEMKFPEEKQRIMDQEAAALAEMLIREYSRKRRD